MKTAIASKTSPVAAKVRAPKAIAAKTAAKDATVASAPVAPEPAPQPAVAAQEAQLFTSQWADSDVIALVADAKAPRPESKRGIGFALYRDGLTVGEFVKLAEAAGLAARRRLSSDSRRGVITITPAQ